MRVASGGDIAYVLVKSMKKPLLFACLTVLLMAGCAVPEKNRSAVVRVSETPEFDQLVARATISPKMAQKRLVAHERENKITSMYDGPGPVIAIVDGKYLFPAPDKWGAYPVVDMNDGSVSRGVFDGEGWYETKETSGPVLLR